MDDFKPEDDMKADRNDRRAGRSRQSSERDADPQINFDDVDLDADEGRPTRAGKARREREEEEFEEELDAQDEEMLEEQPVERRPRKRKKAPAKPASRQYIMMGVGILVLLLLIVGIGSALKSPSSSSQLKNSPSRITPYLMTSASPEASSRFGRVFRQLRSTTTETGCQKAPIMFLPRGWFTAVLPPTDESTCDNRVVGTWMKRTPR